MFFVFLLANKAAFVYNYDIMVGYIDIDYNDGGDSLSRYSKSNILDFMK